MLGIEPKRTNQQKQTVHPVVAGVAGMIAGATAVTAIALTDEDIRKKAVKRAKEARKKLQSWSDSKLHEYKANNQGADGNGVVEELRIEEKQLRKEPIEK